MQIHGESWVMFDIDDTLIDRDGFIISRPYDLLQDFIERNYHVVIITARSSDSREYTENQLEEYGIQYNLLLFSPPDQKIHTKKLFFDTPLACSVGDLVTDLGYSHRNILVQDYELKEMEHTM